MSRIGVERRRHIFMDALLQIDAKSAQGAHHHVRANTLVRRHIAHGIGNSPIGRIVGDAMLRAFDSGGGESLAQAFSIRCTREQEGKKQKDLFHNFNVVQKSGGNWAAPTRVIVNTGRIVIGGARPIKSTRQMEGDMRAILLLALRASTGLLLIIWGALRAFKPATGVGLADKYYGGAINAEHFQLAMGWGEIVLGVLVLLGLFRVIVYPLQALILVGGALAIWKYLVDPLGLYLLTEETRKILFFPSTTVAIASLIMLVFKDEDTIALDRIFRRG